MPSNSEKLKNILDKTINTVGNIANNITNFNNVYYRPNFSERPIGLANKASRNWREGVMRDISRNIGEYRMQSKERITTPIGELADLEYNQKEGKPWFLTDDDRNRYYDYLDYIDSMYFYGTKKLLNYKNPNGIREVGILDPSAAEPGVIHKIKDWNIPNPTLNGSDVWNTSTINAVNGGIGTRGNDTRLGAISNYYLIKTLENAQDWQKQKGYSNYTKPKDETNANENESVLSLADSRITRGAYYEFGSNGKFGISGNSELLTNGVTPNSYFLNEVIPWSTADTVYDTRLITNDLDRVEGIQKRSDVDYVFLDKAQDTTASHEYYPFGNYYSSTYSLGLIGASGAKTQRNIANSMLGFPLTRTEVDYSSLLTGETSDMIISAHKKYYVGNGTRGTNYIDKMTYSNVDFIKFGSETKNKNIVRLELQDAGNDNLWSAKSVYQHREAEGNAKDSPLISNGITNYNQGIEWGNYKLFDKDVIVTKPDIIKKTNELFMNNKIKTIIGRFHTDEIGSVVGDRMDKDFIGSATSRYGASRGRNLLKKDHKNKKTNGYSDPYCRVWTYHHEYSTLKDLIRPFIDKDSLDGTEISNYRTVGVIKEIADDEGNIEKFTWDSGQKRLEELGARIKSNKLIRFSPTRDGNEVLKDQLKHLMFSIENLAWKDCTDYLDEDQKGPLGGRIMWFPPYGLEFNESVGVNWNDTEFIGRGEKIPTYINTNRGGTLSFDILVDHPSVVNSYAGKGIGGQGIGDVDDVESNEQTLLRFFAGCEVLGQTTETYVKEQEPSQPKPPSPITVEKPEVTEQECFSFYVFFPNNYSGVDDDSDYFARYILKGTGSGYAKFPNGVVDTAEISNETKDFNGIGYEMLGNRIPHYGGLNGIIRTPEDFDKKGLDAPNGGKWCSYYNPKSCDKGAHHWGYRIDEKYRCQDLKDGNYCDNASFGMNSSLGYTDGIAVLTQQEATENDFAFSEVYTALTINNPLILESELANPSNVETLEQKLVALRDMAMSKTSKSKFIITVSGFASKHGYEVLNSELFNNRAKTLKNWLQKTDSTLFSNAEVKYDKLEVPQKQLIQNVDLYEAKASRAAKVTISFKTEELVSNGNINILDNETEMKSQLAQEDYNEIMLYGSNSQKNAKRKETIAEAEETVESLATMTQVEFWDRLKEELGWEAKAKRDGNTIPKAWSETQEEKEKALGYKNEYKFFSELEKNDSFLHSKIVNKIKFFDPAFHSITPEGYQSRLTFLHQCTRQGSTSGWTDGSSIRTAANLAFGRPPILVLRIGDFYNTKIIIKQLSIDFKTSSGISWDLNDEGIGIMPMYAHISINFEFYGGSDLGGPISRLQNAVSFNYYANTGVYDDRSEMVQYNDDGTLARVKPFDVKMTN